MKSTVLAILRSRKCLGRLPRQTSIAILFVILGECQALGDPISYVKTFFLEGVDPEAKIFAGAQVQTWAGPEIKPANHNMFRDIKVPYKHADPMRTKSGTINGGFPMTDTQFKVSEGYDRETGDVKDNHTAPNSGSATIIVNKGVSDRTVDVWDPVTEKNKSQELKKSSRVRLLGAANAGKPEGKNEDHLHSADSFAGAHINAARMFEYDATLDQDVLKWKLVGRNRIVGGGDTVNGAVVDPYFIEVMDLDTGIATTQVVMTQTLDFTDALVLVDDIGLRFAIDRRNPDSMVSFSFSSEFPWVLNPYSYSVKLDATGLAVSGTRFPLTGWQMSMTADSVEAFFPFGPDLLAFDMAEAELPRELFTTSHTYHVGAGTSDGAYEIAAPVPEPSTIAVAGLGVMGLVARAWGRRKRR